MRKLQSQTGVAAPDADNLKGKIVDGQTVVGEGINGDIIEFFHKMVSAAGITENTLPDNESNGHQLLEALDKWRKSVVPGYTQIIGVDLPLGTGFSIYSGSGDCICTTGKKLDVHLKLMLTRDNDTRSAVCTLPGGLRPTTAVTVGTFIFGGGSDRGTATINTDGTVVISTGDAYLNISIDAHWVTYL